MQDDPELLERKIEELRAELEARERIEAELERSRLFLEESQRIAHLGSWEWDIGTDTITWSEELYRLYGLDPTSDPPGFDEFLQFLPEPDRTRLQQTVEHSLATGEPFALDHRIECPDGTRRVLHGRGRVLRADDGSPAKMIGSGQDITERHRREEERRFLAEAGQILASSLDYEETLQRVARLAVPTICDWCVVDVVEDEGIRRVALAHPDPARMELAATIASRWPMDSDAEVGVPQVIRTGRPELYPEITDALLERATQDAEHLDAVGSIELRSAMIVPIMARDVALGAITFVAGESGRRFSDDDLGFASQLASRAALAIDNARAYGRARKAIEARDEMMSIVSHDLRGPLQTILNAANILLEAPDEAVDREALLHSVKRSVELMDRLTRDLLDFARLRAGQLSIHASPERVATVVREAAEMWRRSAAENGIELEIDIEQEDVIVSFDRQRIVQVLNNLISNAIKYTPQNGRVGVTARGEPDNLVLEVWDTGPGIAEEHVERLFDRFWRGDKRPEGGAGLGLTIARGLVEAHDGKIEVDSRAGEGARFRVRLPRVVDDPTPGTGAGVVG